MISLNDLVSRHAKQPLMRLVGLALGVQLLYFGYLTYNRYVNQRERIEQMREAISLGVQQSNRPLIESSMTSALVNSDIALAALCSGPAVSISFPPSEAGYCGREARSLWRWSVRKPLIGVQGLNLVVVLCPLAAFGPLLFLMSITMVMLASIIWTMSRVRRLLEDELLNPLYGGLNNELPLKVSELEDLRLRNLEHMRLVREQAASDAMVQLAAQVAHDIRSPLAALGAAAKGLEMPEDQRKLVEGAVGRMQGIADDLLQRYRAPSAGQAAAKTAVYALGGLIEQVLSEKRLQHKAKTGVKIEFNGAPGEIKALVEPKELQRLLSNLINNSVEAFAGPGEVAISLSALDGKVLIEVKDNGKGIPLEILAKLGQKGETHGKAGGTGLGLYHARVSVERWGGSLKITSKAGKGTTVSITLPAAARPAAGLRAALLDDDPLVHMNWRLAAKAAGAWLQSFKTPQEFTVAAETLPRDIPLYIDSDLGNDIKGEEIAKDLREKGFTDITMATGHGAEKFSHLPWLKVAGKEPPWA